MDKKTQEEANEEKFLKALTELTKKHKLVIGGCGCCGSPYVQPLDKKSVEGFQYFHGDSKDSGCDLQWRK